MGGRRFYEVIHADYEGSDNLGGLTPGFLVEVVENDGGVGVLLTPCEGMDNKGAGRAQVHMTASEARELQQGLQEAIEQAEFKNADRGIEGPPSRSRQAR